ncbi:MAG: hypothetical protein CMQ83_01045 [Gammaproteobacteria bacterium]|nr:hypothetical protein [Gammaproteobacteria bacterium]|tara:strand:+ start:2399 stop:3700 length:1302 start_codon:yes stop_codon:yes gene_type:complete
MKQNKLKTIQLLLAHLSLFLVVLQTSTFLPTFVDEIVAIGSTVNFLTSFDFQAEPLLSGSYSTSLTTGPLSSIGGSLGWVLSQDLQVSRVLNFYYVVLISFFIFKSIISDKDISLFTLLSISLLLIPWWFGVLYSIGEIVSMFVFISGILYLNKNEKIAYFMLSSSIIFFKFSTILPMGIFLFFYILMKIIKREFRILNFLFFLTPMFIWGLMSSIKLGFSDGFKNIFDMFFYHLFHEGSGLNNFNLASVVELVKSSEVANWSNASLVRILLVPILFNFFLLKNRKLLNEKYIYLIYPLIYSNLFTYAWFWLSSPKKYIRYSQHFIVLVVFFSIYFLLSRLKISKFDKVILVLIISTFFSSEILILLFFITSLLFIFKNIKISSSLLIWFLILNNFNILFENNTKDIQELKFNECNKEILDSDCVLKYLGIEY